MLNGKNGHSGGNKPAVIPADLAILYSDVAEKAVLGSLLIDNDAYGYVRPIVEANDFYLVRHRWIYEEITTLIESGEPVDMITLPEQMNRRDKSPDGGWEAFIIGLTLEVPTSFNAPHYARIVREYATRRRMVLAAAQISQSALDFETPLDDSLAVSENAALNIRGSRADIGVKSAAELARYYLDRFETLMDERRDIIGLPTGFIDIDRFMKGLDKQFYILAGRPGMGKSALALSILLNVVIRQEKNAMLFSLEMNEVQMMNRAISSEAEIPLERVKNPSLMRDTDFPKFYEALGRIGQSKLFIDATPGLTPSQIRAKALRKSIEVGGLDLVVIDHIHIMQPDNPNLMDTAALTSISKQVMTFPKLLGCPVLVLAQLSRSLEQRQNKRPMLSDLRQSGSLEEDAFAVMFLYRDDYYEKELSERPNVAEVEVAKNRDGETGTIDLYWQGELTAFRNLQRKQVQP